ncbi:hypothetical protein D3C72_2580800 [compost metagenome]
MGFQAHGLEFFWRLRNQFKRQFPRLQPFGFCVVFKGPFDLLFLLIRAQRLDFL